MTKGRKMEPRPSSTSGSLSFSSGAMDSKSLAKNSSGSLALVRGLRLWAVSACAAASMACDGPASRVGARETSTARPDAGAPLLVRVLLEDLLPHVRARY